MGAAPQTPRAGLSSMLKAGWGAAVFQGYRWARLLCGLHIMHPKAVTAAGAGALGAGVVLPNTHPGAAPLHPHGLAVPWGAGDFYAPPQV